jgi:cell division protein ZipA
MNWSLMLNGFLLAGVVIAIVRTIKARSQRDIKKAAPAPKIQPQTNFYDDIVAVRRVDDSDAPSSSTKPVLSPSLRYAASLSTSKKIKIDDDKIAQPSLRTEISSLTPQQDVLSQPVSMSPSVKPIIMFLLAKANRQLAGYELLQAVLSAGFRFGEGDLFHRHQYQNGQGSIMCTLAAATSTGVFDLQNIGGFVVHGLCLFMSVSGDPDADAERFDIMMDSAKTLSDSLDTHLLDDQREPLSEQSITRYHQKLRLNEACVLMD